jgi:3-oxoacyl-[acyl-carrier protein] reductase
VRHTETNEVKETTMVNRSDKVAIVTGASRGIGATIAERLAKDGLAVVVNYAGSVDAAQAVVAKIEQGGGRALAVKGDVSDSKAFALMFDKAEATFGGVDVLVNNAGIMTLARVADSSDELFDRQIAVNLKGAFNGMREAGRRLRNGGRIVNVSTSIVGTKLETYAVYAATKAGVELMTAIVAKEMRGRSITVNAVAPGPVSTDLFLEGKSAELVERMAKQNPFERIGTPEDIAAVVSFLVGPDGGWINGQVLRANGGLV